MRKALLLHAIPHKNWQESNKFQHSQDAISKFLWRQFHINGTAVTAEKRKHWGRNPFQFPYTMPHFESRYFTMHATPDFERFCVWCLLCRDESALNLGGWRRWRDINSSSLRNTLQAGKTEITLTLSFWVWTKYVRHTTPFSHPMEQGYALKSNTFAEKFKIRKSWGMTNRISKYVPLITLS